MRRLYLLLGLTGWLYGVPAEAEVTNCQVISTLPAIIETPGVWCLKSDLEWTHKTGTAIFIRSDYVTLDLNEHLLEHAGSVYNRSYGIRVNGNFNATVRNGRISGFSRGISFEGPVDRAGGHLIENVELTRIRGGAIFLGRTPGNVIRNNRLVNNGRLGAFYGILLSDTRDALVLDNVVSNTIAGPFAIGIQVNFSTGVIVRGNSVQETTHRAVYVHGGNAILVDSNRLVNGNGGGASILNDDATALSCTNNVIVGFATAVSGCAFESGNIDVPAGVQAKQ